jgi:hypothetical protein
MKDIIRLGNPAEVRDAVLKIAESSGGKSLKIMRSAFMLLSDLWRGITSDVTLDPFNKPYFAHFYECTHPSDDRGLSLLGGELKFQSARSRMLNYWNLAAGYYAGGDAPRAFVALGHLVHLVGDLHVPAHVHNTPHGSSVLLCKPDSLEEWTARKDYPVITRSKGRSNATIWSARNVAVTPMADGSWNSGNLADKLGSFALAMSFATQKFRSVDAPGRGLHLYQDRTGALDDGECFYQGETLMPAAIRDSAQIIINFVDYAKRNGQPVEAKRT